MPHQTTVPCSKGAVLVVAALAVIALSGCGKGLPTSPIEENAASTASVSKAPAAPTTTTSDWTWYQVASQWVNKGEAATVSGGRSKIQFVRGSLCQGATIVLKERSPSISDVVIGPSGMALSKAATLTISYAGSTVEFTPDLLKLFRFNESAGSWEVVTGSNDFAAKTFTAKVSVLGRYAVSPGDPTKAGW